MVTSVRERHQSRRSSYRNGVLTHTRQWLVKCDSSEDGTFVALTANDGTRAVPTVGSTHNQDGAAKLTGLDAEPHQDSDRHFIVTGEYTSTSLIALPVNPMDRPGEITYGYQDGTEDYFLDRSDPPKPVTNSAGDHFESNLQRETGELILTITVNETSFNPVAIDEFKHTTNNDAVTIDGVTYAIGTLKLSAPTAQKVTERIEENGAVVDITYYRVTYVLKARKDGWKDKPLDIGTNERIGDLGTGYRLRPIVDGANLPVKRPYPLDGEGKRKPNPTDTPAELEFRPYRETGWSGLKFTQETAWA